MDIERSLLWAGAATITALILVALSLSLAWFHVDYMEDQLIEGTYYQRSSGIEGFSAVQTWLTFGWLFFGWLLLMSWFINARIPSTILSWVLLALAVTTFAHFTAYIWVAVSNSTDAPVRGFFGRQFELGAGYWDYGPGSGWGALLMATVLQVMGSVILMAKGFSIDRKESDIEPPGLG